MAEIDSDNNQANEKRWNDTTHTPVHFFMTQERIQLLNLLKHLITNSDQSIVVCGPEGVGKTTLLKMLQRDKFISFQTLSVNNVTGVNSDVVQKLIDKAAKQDKREKQRRFTDPEGQKSGNPPKTICLIIDNAGALAPGIMTGVMELANENPLLRLIFVMTHDQLYLKNRSDRAIEDCHVVEVPPFTEEQSADFLLHLSSKSSAAVPKNAITDSLIEGIYKQTDGIAAGIIAKYPELVKAKVHEDPTRILIIAVISLVAVALVVQWFSSREPIKETNRPIRSAQNDFDTESKLLNRIMPALSSAYRFQHEFIYLNLDKKFQKREGFAAAKPLLHAGKNAQSLTPPTDSNRSEPIPAPETSTVTDLVKPKISDKKQPADHLPPVEQTAKAEEIPAAFEAAGQEASKWLASQPKTNYTLQLMVLSKQQSISSVVRKYPALRKNFKYVKTILKGKEKFVLLYGSFNDRETANAVKQTLPVEFRASVTRKFSAVINDFGKGSALQ